MGKDFPKSPGYLRIKLLFQPRDSVLKGYEEIAICDFNIPVLWTFSGSAGKTFPTYFRSYHGKSDSSGSHGLISFQPNKSQKCKSKTPWESFPRLTFMREYSTFPCPGYN